MISLIICSRNTDISSELKQNIQSTIGIEYELIIIDNSNNKYSIFQAYNEGVRRSKYPYLCFMHEDVLYHTQEWGERVVAHLDNPSMGIIGVAGCHFVPRLPGSHWSSGITSYNVVHTNDNKTEYDSWRYIDSNATSLNAVLVDGLWFCISKSVMERVRFDDMTFSGFHCYDSDISLQILHLNYEARIVFDIKIEHFSLGVRNRIWLENMFVLFNKWKRYLPISVVELSKYKISESNFLNAKELIEQIKINNLGRMFIVKVWFYYIQLNFPINRRNIRNLKLLLKCTFC